ncbi:MAG: hypothetical protein LC677_15835 [Halomonas sp.]|nr:hypothetical protein [Halomonas sp.]
MILTSDALQALGVPLHRITRHLQEQRASHYRMLRELFRGNNQGPRPAGEQERLHSVVREESTQIVVNDVLVLLGTQDDLEKVERRLTGACTPSPPE